MRRRGQEPLIGGFGDPYVGRADIHGGPVASRSSKAIPEREAISPREKTLKVLALIGLVALITVVVMGLKPIPQDRGYHNFADTRRWWGTKNGLNVLSNVPFAIVGLHGLLITLWTWSDTSKWKHLIEKFAYVVLFVGVMSVCWGSSYYHLDPKNQTLYWDRLPMSVAFMALFSAMLVERVSRKAGLIMFLPLLAAGVWSVGYWLSTEAKGKGDLRPYIIVQFGPMVCAPLLLGWFPSKYTDSAYYWSCLLLYVLAKVAEVGDKIIYNFTLRCISGHSLKHLLAAGAIEALCIMLHIRVRKLPPKLL